MIGKRRHQLTTKNEESLPEAIFKPYRFGEEERAQFDRDGHYLLPGLLRADACEQLAESCEANQDLLASKVEGKNPKHYSAEFDSYFERLIVHPQLLEMARSVLGPNIRLDHCVTLNRRGGYPGSGWHSHPYANDNPDLGLVRIFFYVNGFEAYDGALKVVPGSHLFRDSTIEAETDEELLAGWMAEKTHPLTGEPLRIVELSAPPGSVALLWDSRRPTASVRDEPKVVFAGASSSVTAIRDSLVYLDGYGRSSRGRIFQERTGYWTSIEVGGAFDGLPTSDGAYWRW